MLELRAISASRVKIGDRIVDPNVIRPYLTRAGLLPDEMAEASFPVLAVGVLRDIEADKRDEIIKNTGYSLDTVIIMVRVSGELPEVFKVILPNKTMNLFYSPSDIVTILHEYLDLEEDECTYEDLDLEDDECAYGDFNLEEDDWHPCSGCKYHKYSYGKNICSLGNCCDDYDEENPCGERF